MPIHFVVIIRSAISFFALLLFIRLMGKQQVSQLNFFDYVVGITIGAMDRSLVCRFSIHFFVQHFQKNGEYLDI